MKTIGCALFIIFTCLLACRAVTERVWTNTLGGSWSNPLNWSPNGVPSASDSANITNSGTYTVYATNDVSFQSGFLGSVGGSGTQTLILDKGITFACALWHVQTSGDLVISNANYSGHLALHTNAHMRLDGPLSKSFTSMWFFNFGGWVLWRDGPISMNGAIAWIENDGVWQMQMADNSVHTLSASAGSMLWTNNGVLRKDTSTGEIRITGFNLINNQSGVVDVKSGTLTFQPGQTNILGGTFTAVAGATMSFAGAGTYYDAGGVFNGPGLNQFVAANLHLRTNILAGLKLTGGHVILGTNFQQAGVITNLTLDGSILDGMNQVAGTLTVNSGGFGTNLSILPGGHLVFATADTKNFVGASLINQGTVTWSGGALQWGAVTTNGGIVNYGVWDCQGDDQLDRASGSAPTFINNGTFIKTSGGGDMTRVDGINFTNGPTGNIQVDAGTLRMPQNYTNSFGTLHLNGGQLGGGSGGFSGFGTLYLAGGTLDGNGTLGGGVVATGGTISPGNSPGAMQFSSGLTMSNSSTLVIDGTGTSPGSGYDQLSVTGAVNVTGCTLQLGAMPSVPSGTTFTIIQNDGSDAVQGTFAGLPENLTVATGAGTYRIHYAGGSGNDITLVNESGPPPNSPSLTSGGYNNGAFHLLGSGSSPIIYTIQATTNFLQWTNIGTAMGDAGGAISFTDTNASKFRYRFYRTTN